MTAMIIGSATVTCGAMLSNSNGIILAAFAELMAPKWIRRTLRATLEVLAGIPSVIYGFWGLTSLVPQIYKRPARRHMYVAGILVLSVMILPNSMCLFVANGIAICISKRLAIILCKSLDISQFTMIFKVIMPSLKGHILSGILISFGRAVRHETMAVLMVCGNISQIPSSIFDPIRTLTSNIALEMAYALGQHRSALFPCDLS